MSTLHVFAIGGTGSRVLRSLTMLLATGVKCDQTIHPIIIDPDHSNEDVSRTSLLIKDYCKLRAGLALDSSTKVKFFSTNFDTHGDLRMPIENTSDKRFRDYIRVSSMSHESRALMHGLFSDDDLDATMEVGFEGHPNRGSVVLNQIASTHAFNSFANSFKQDDNIMIISSIFGGTGASGFPLLLKILRENKDIPNHKLINEAPIGAISVLPYFKVKKDNDSPIDSATFISKARSALQYYKRTMSNGKALQCLYYIGDQTAHQYDNHKGGQEQRNDAHFVELASALAVVDFANKKPTATFKEFGIKDNVNRIIFSNLGDETRNLIKVPMTQWALLYHLFTKHYDDMKRQSYVKDRGDDFLNEDWVMVFQSMLGKYNEWLEELAANEISFAPFKLVNDASLTKDPLDIINGVKHHRPLIGKTGFNHFDEKITKQVSPSHSNIQIFADKLYLATKDMAEKDYVGL